MSDSDWAVPEPDAPHFVGDIDPAVLFVTETRSLIRAPLTEVVRSPTGCASIGVLMTLVDVVASDPSMVASRPDWTVTQDLSLHGAAWIAEGPIVVDSSLVRAGKKTVVVDANVYDGRGIDDFDELQAAIDDGALTLAASGLITFARIPRTAAPGMDEYDPSTWIGQVRHHRRANVSDTRTIYERIGLRTIDAPTGQLELDRTPYVINSVGTINGGTQAVMLEAAAQAMRPGLAATDMELHYLSQVKAGPVRTVGTVLRDAGDHSVVSVKLVDAGHNDQLLTLATITLQPPPD